MNWLQKTSSDIVSHARNVAKNSLSMIPSFFPSDLKEEIEYLLGIWVESIKIGDQLNENPFGLLYDIVGDVESDASAENNRRWMVSIRRWLIELGVYAVITPEEMQAMSTLGGKRYDFKMNGMHYIFKNHPLGLNR